MKNTLVVRLVNCYAGDSWYCCYINSITDVIDNGWDYIMLDDYLSGYGVAWRHIRKEDCEILSIKEVQLDS